MKNTSPSLPSETEPVRFGFLDVIELPGLGFVGGLLVVSSIGRPLEFHCTAPVQPSRTQQIMYGATCREHLLVDQIAGALIDRIQTAPHIFVIQRGELQTLADQLDTPVIWAESRQTEASLDAQRNHGVEIGEFQVWISNLLEEERDRLVAHARHFAARLPFDEPFERISQALEEAHAVVRAA